MPCPHRYLGLHIDGQLFPDWEIDYLFIGTFNPLWDRPDLVNAAYFYGRSAYFWDAVSIFFKDRPYSYARDDQQAMVDFCKRHKIGFTDLILDIEDADWANPEHRQRIYSVLDTDLEQFDEIVWNTTAIEAFLQDNKPGHVFFTLLSGNKKSIFSVEMRKIEQQAASLKINCKRLHSPTGANVGTGVPRLHQLVERWDAVKGLPQIDLSRYPYVQDEKRARKKPSQKKPRIKTYLETSDNPEILVMDRYVLCIEAGKKVILIDRRNNMMLKALTVLRDTIVPHIKLAYGIEVDLHHSSKGRGEKNTRVLGQEVFRILSGKNPLALAEEGLEALQVNTGY
ncbi:hypothetical protein ASU31_12940 [Pedobacter ginsenosidimutans]|uniref:Uncharacterized protein n=1 Tax=Pedobacter ginsenosidimutans TaxID=687842 RepID=A0A0T5VPU1_9SPHI|nr:hypothetical protein [Pedobacter ginsenosidimutans]KRT15882.1 hypothetical protein ASU31_12940 [Pedobacter ginsenosidimutans]